MCENSSSCRDNFSSRSGITWSIYSASPPLLLSYPLRGRSGVARNVNWGLASLSPLSVPSAFFLFLLFPFLLLRSRAP